MSESIQDQLPPEFPTTFLWRPLTWTPAPRGTQHSRWVATAAWREWNCECYARWPENEKPWFASITLKHGKDNNVKIGGRGRNPNQALRKAFNSLKLLRNKSARMIEPRSARCPQP